MKGNILKMKWNAKRPADLISMLILLAGIILILIQYFQDRSLWLDESSLAMNLLERDGAELLKPLDYLQSAPALFLLAVDGLTHIFGPGEYVLRALSLLAALASLFLFHRILKRFRMNPVLVISALALFVFNWYFLFYSSEFKQYMIDMLLALFFLNLSLDISDKGFKGTELILTGIIGAIGIWLSNAMVVILLSNGLFLLAGQFRRKLLFSRQSVLPWQFLWLISFVVYYLFFIRDNPLEAYMRSFWSKSFAPGIPSNFGEVKWYGYAFIHLIKGFFRVNGFYWIIYAPFFILGVFRSWKVLGLSLSFLFLFPVAAHLVLSAFKLYPFESRFIYYFSAGTIILTALGFAEIIRWVLRERWPWFSYAAVVIFAIPAIYFSLREYPFHPEDINPVIEVLNEESDPGDKVIVDIRSNQQFRYYLETDRLDIDKGQVIFVRNDEVWNKTRSAAFNATYRSQMQAALEQAEGSDIWYFVSGGIPSEAQEIMMIRQLFGADREEMPKYQAESVEFYFYPSP